MSAANGDSDLENLIGRVLRVGVGISTACLLVGLALELAAPALGVRVLNLGIVLLLVTPTARVVLSMIEFAARREWRFAALTAIVLAELVSGAIAAVWFHRSLG